MTSDSAEPTAVGREAFSTRTIVGTVLAVCAVNLAVLLYAVHVTNPERVAGSVPPSSAAEAGEFRVAQQGGAAPSAGSEAAAGIERFVEGATVTTVELPAEERVKEAFARHCSACHGLDGRGDGPAAERLLPKPRDFVDSPLRFASTGGTREEVIAAIERTVSRGVPRSAMPGFGGVLDEGMIAGLARYVAHLREAGGGSLVTPVTVDLGEKPPFTKDLIARGKKLFVGLGCVNCHGESGRGDGPGSVGLVDSVGRPVRPADFASGLFKSGQSPESIAHTIAVGVPGTPMIAYGPTVIRQTSSGGRDTSDLWALASYVLSFAQPREERGVASGAEIAVARVADAAILEDPNHPAWIGIPHRLVQVKPVWQRHEETTFAVVRAARTDDEIAVCLEWRDPSFDVVRGMGVFPDGAAVMFAMGDGVPALPMGVETAVEVPTEPVNIWHWRADLQWAGATKTQPWALARRPVPPLGVALLDGGAPGRFGTEPREPLTDYPPTSMEEAFRGSAAAFGNVLAAAVGLGKTALDANAVGFGSLALQPIEEQNLSSVALWSRGTWRVVLRRSFARRGDLDVRFDYRKRIPVAFAFWNGSQSDHGGVKLVTAWHWLVLED